MIRPMPLRPDRLVALAAAAALLVAFAAPAAAKTSRRASYDYERVWPAAVRFLRIDEGLKLVEKDADAGYVLFELEEEGKTFRGALEIIRRKDSVGRDAVELVLHIEDRPSYMEYGILDRLMDKLRTELGQPKRPPPREPKKPEPEPDGDAAR